MERGNTQCGDSNFPGKIDLKKMYKKPGKTRSDQLHIIRTRGPSIFFLTPNILKARKPMSHPSFPQLKNTLENWHSQVPRHCLDFRTSEAYLEGHLLPSTSIPINTFEGRFSQLPPKASKETLLVVVEKGMLFNGQPVAELLQARGWCVSGVIELPVDNIAAGDFWQYAREKGVFGMDQEGRELLFKPSPLLSTWIQHIEKEFMSTGNMTSAVMDVGCGSGRDLGFLASREYMWHVTGLDNWRKALDRARVMVNSINANRLGALVYAKIEDDGRITSLSNELVDLSALSHKFSLFLIIRYFPRLFFQHIHRYFKPGGYLLFSHFTDPLPEMEDYDSPMHDRRVLPGEVETLLSKASTGWEILNATYSHSEDSRPMWNVVARWWG
jgi:SAM-dependent methyltransferase